MEHWTPVPRGDTAMASELGTAGRRCRSGPGNAGGVRLGRFHVRLLGRASGWRWHQGVGQVTDGSGRPYNLRTGKPNPFGPLSP